MPFQFPGINRPYQRKAERKGLADPDIPTTGYLPLDTVNHMAPELKRVDGVNTKEEPDNGSLLLKAVGKLYGMIYE